MNASPELRLILAARAERLPPALAETGFVPMGERDAVRFLEDAGLWFGPRRTLEELEAYRQVIPYIILRVGDRIIRYRRTPSGGEVRLHGRTSIGIGGHVDLADAISADDRIDLLATVERAAARELEEELGHVTCLERRWVGLLVDNDTPVGRVHVGLIGLWRIDNLPGGQVENAVADVAAVTIEQLEKEADSLETWSALLLPWLGAELVRNQTSLEEA